MVPEQASERAPKVSESERRLVRGRAARAIGAGARAGIGARQRGRAAAAGAALGAREARGSRWGPPVT